MAIRQKIAIGGLSGSLAIAGMLVTYFEGRSLIAYLDPVGIPTICEGVTQGVQLGDTATPQECDEKLEKELRAHAAFVDDLVKVPLKTNEYAAYVSFVYNVGGTNFKNSTLLKKLNAGDHVGACKELPRWVYAGGKKLRGLERRRQAEMELCLLLN